LPTSLCLADYRYFGLDIAASSELPERYVRIRYQIDDGEGKVQTLPLLGGSEPHAYVLDLKLLELPRTARLMGIEIAPWSAMVDGDEAWFQVANPRLLRRDTSEQCFQP
jgi:hypothetical protein